jgi:hypothetical protein
VDRREKIWREQFHSRSSFLFPQEGWLFWSIGNLLLHA